MSFASHRPGVYLAEPGIEIAPDRDRAGASARACTANARFRWTRKVAIVAEADRLQPQAANAFLKTLEEPPNDSLLLLLSAMPEALPDTILSRCIALPLAMAEKGNPSAEEEELLELLGTVASPVAKGVQHPIASPEDSTGCSRK